MNKLIQKGFVFSSIFCLLILTGINITFGADQTILQEKVREMLQWQPQINESTAQINLRKSDIETVLKDIRLLKYQKAEMSVQEKDLNQLEKIHQYYSGLFAIKVTSVPLKLFHKKYCQSAMPDDIWCQSAQNSLNPTSDSSEPPQKFASKPTVQSSQAAQHTNLIPKSNAEPSPIPSYKIPLKPLPVSNQDEQPEFKNNYNPGAATYNYNQYESTNIFHERNQTLGQKITAFHQLVVRYGQGNSINRADLVELFPEHSFPQSIKLDRDIVGLVKSLNEKIVDQQKYNYNYDLYHSFGQFRKADKRYDDYLENICLAYVYADICGKIKILKELNVLKKQVLQHVFTVSQTSIDALTKAGLLQHWNENTLFVGVKACYCP